MKRKITEFQFGIFDCDGVLIDSMPFYTQEFAKILNEKVGIPPRISKKFYKETAGTPSSKQFEQILNLYNKTANIQELTTLFLERIFNRILKRKFKVFPGVRKVLKQLQKLGLKIFVTSGSSYQDLEIKLGQHNLLIYFDLIMSSDEIPKSIEHIKIFANWCGLSLEEFAKKAFYVGDGPTDIKIAREAGVYSVGIINTCDAEVLRRAGAQEIIRSLTEILK